MTKDQTSTQASSNKTLGWVLGIIGAFLGGAAIAGLIVFFWQKGKVDQAEQASTQIEQNLLEQLDDDHTRPADDETSTDTSAQEEKDGRTLLEPEFGRSYNSELMASNPDFCFEDFNTDPADTSVEYESTTRGLRISVPFNAAWGTADYRINPYDETSGSTFDGSSPALLFGPLISGFEGCGWIRTNSIEFVDARTVAEARAAAEADASPDFPIEDLTTSTIGDNTVVSFRYGGGLCEDLTYEVIGNEHNYRLGGCYLGEEPIEDVIESMEIL